MIVLLEMELQCSLDFFTWRADERAKIAQLWERHTDDLKVPLSIPGFGTPFYFIFLHVSSNEIRKSIE